MNTNRPRVKSASQPIDRLFLAVLLGAVAILFAVGALGWYIHERMDTFDSGAVYRPPMSDATGVVPEGIVMADGRTVYVPAYSHIYSQAGRPLRLAVTLSVRNASPKDSITLRSVQYFDSNGKFVRSFTDQTIEVAPLATKEFFVPENDTEGGAGANFIVQWTSATADVIPPIVEAVMISTAGQQGVSFASRGVELYPAAVMRSGGD